MSRVDPPSHHVARRVHRRDPRYADGESSLRLRRTRRIHHGSRADQAQQIACGSRCEVGAQKNERQSLRPQSKPRRHRPRCSQSRSGPRRTYRLLYRSDEADREGIGVRRERGKTVAPPSSAAVGAASRRPCGRCLLNLKSLPYRFSANRSFFCRSRSAFISSTLRAASGRVARPLIFADTTTTVGAPSLRFLQGRVPDCRQHRILHPRSRHSIAKRNLSPAHIYLHRSRFLQPIESVTAPPPLLRRFHQSTSYRIAMHVPQLLHPLRHSPYIEIIEARLPERSSRLLSKQLALPSIPTLSPGKQRPRRTLLDDLHHGLWTPYLRFGQQQMHMFWHNDIAHHDKSVTLPRLLQDREESVAGSRRT